MLKLAGRGITSRHVECCRQCPLSGGKADMAYALHMSAYDPKQTWCGTAEFLATQRPLNREAALIQRGLTSMPRSF